MTQRAKQFGAQMEEESAKMRIINKFRI